MLTCLPVCVQVRHAAVISGSDPKAAHVLNVGFGLGLIDTALQGLGVASHTIIEVCEQVVFIS